MPKTSKDTNSDALEEVVKLLALLARRGTSKASLIYELNELGFKPKRIAELLSTTPNTVSVALSTMRRRGR
jgi:DNA-directed RNA polymerase specialized sigma24 family protein